MVGSPTWRTIDGQGSYILYDNAWLLAHAVEWHLDNTGEHVTLHYLASEPMPLTHATMQTVTMRNPPLTQAQEDVVRRIVAEEIKKLEKRITNVVIYDLSQRMKLMNGKKEQG